MAYSGRRGDVTLLPDELPLAEGPLNTFDWSPLLPYLGSLGYELDQEFDRSSKSPSARFRASVGAEPWVFISYIDIEETGELGVYQRLKLGDPAIRDDPRNPLLTVIELCDPTPPGEEQEFCLLVTKQACEDERAFYELRMTRKYPSQVVATFRDVLQGIAFFHEHSVIHGPIQTLLWADKPVKNRVAYRFLLHGFGVQGQALPLGASTVLSTLKWSTGIPPEIQVPQGTAIPPVDGLRMDIWFFGTFLSSALNHVPELWDTTLGALVQRMTHLDPVTRPTASAALARFSQEEESLVELALRLDESTESYRELSGLEIATTRTASPTAPSYDNAKENRNPRLSWV